MTVAKHIRSNEHCVCLFPWNSWKDLSQRFRIRCHVPACCESGHQQSPDDDGEAGVIWAEEQPAWGWRGEWFKSHRSITWAALGAFGMQCSLDLQMNQLKCKREYTHTSKGGGRRFQWWNWAIIVKSSFTKGRTDSLTGSDVLVCWYTKWDYPQLNIT